MGITEWSPLTTLEEKAARAAFYNAMGALDAIIQGRDVASNLRDLSTFLGMWTNMCHCQGLDGTWALGTIAEGSERNVMGYTVTAVSDVRVHLDVSSWGEFRINVRGELGVGLAGSPDPILTQAGFDLGTGGFAGSGYLNMPFGWLHSKVDVYANAISRSISYDYSFGVFFQRGDVFYMPPYGYFSLP